MKGKARLDFLLTNGFKANFTFLMSAFAVVLYAQNPTKERELCMFAILFSTVADLVLMDYNKIPGLLFGKKRFYVGMALFGITHVLYTCCFLGKLAGIETFSMNGAILPLIAAMGVFAFSMFFSMYLTSEKKGDFRVAVFTYVVLINAALISMYIYSFATKQIAAAIGITLFLISDMFILVRETKCDTNLVRKLIWIFYPIGQLLIICGV
ncbi:MAG: lysoplasmalogenase [Clostridia bacterium]|nr:lysoplasmalogenase [Clostridia bacterium]